MKKIPAVSRVADYLQQNKKRIVIALIAALFANAVTQVVWMHMPVPHRIIRTMGGIVIQDYWTTNRYEVVHSFAFGVGTNALPNGMVPVNITNKLW